MSNHIMGYTIEIFTSKWQFKYTMFCFSHVNIQGVKSFFPDGGLYRWWHPCWNDHTSLHAIHAWAFPIKEEWLRMITTVHWAKNSRRVSCLPRLNLSYIKRLETIFNHIHNHFHKGNIKLMVCYVRYYYKVTRDIK